MRKKNDDGIWFMLLLCSVKNNEQPIEQATITDSDRNVFSALGKSTNRSNDFSIDTK